MTESRNLLSHPAQVKKLETELEEAQNAHNDELEANERLIEKLTNQIAQIQTTSTEVNKRIEKESQKRCDDYVEPSTIFVFNYAHLVHLVERRRSCRPLA